MLLILTNGQKYDKIDVARLINERNILKEGLDL